MSRVRLELDELKIERPKRRWNIYFVFATEHPTEDDKFVLTATPNPIIPVRRPADNEIDFSPGGIGTDGLEVIEIDMPDTRALQARGWVMHSRRDVRRAGEVIAGITDGLGTTAVPLVDGFLGANPYWAIAKAALNGLGDVGEGLKKVQDRNMGFISFDEQFGPEFEENIELDRVNNLSTGWGRLVWTWSVVN